MMPARIRRLSVMPVFVLALFLASLAGQSRDFAARRSIPRMS